MHRWCLAAAAAAVVLGLTAPGTGASVRGHDRLEVYSAVVSGAQLGELGRQGIDLSVRRRTERGFNLQLILTDAQRAQLARDGVRTRLTRVKGGKTVKQFAAAQAANGFQVWRSWDEEGGIRDQLRAVARRNPQLAKLETIGTTLQGREILALKLTQGARDVPDGSRPAVLYSSTQHAREWISTEIEPAPDATRSSPAGAPTTRRSGAY